MNANLMPFYHVCKYMDNSCHSLPPHISGQNVDVVGFFFNYLFYFNFFMGNFKKCTKVGEYNEPHVPISPILLSVVHLVPHSLLSPSPLPLTGLFWNKHRNVWWEFLSLWEHIRGYYCQTHREQRGDEKYILKEKGEERRGEKKGQIGTVVRKAVNPSCYSVLFIVTSWIIRKSTFLVMRE